MSIGQIGILLEIVGVILATILAGIVLEKEILGRWSVRIEAWFMKKTKGLDNVIFMQYKMRIKPLAWLLDLTDRYSLITYGETITIAISLIGLFIATLGPIICILIGWLMETQWLFLLGVGVICIELIFCWVSMLFAALFREDDPSEFREAIFLATAYFIVIWLYALALPALRSLVYIVVSIVLSLRIIFDKLSKSGFLKKSLLILGVLMIIIGLILQLMATA